MKKDKLISEKLNIYISGIKPPYGIIYDAVNILKQNNRQNRQNSCVKKSNFRLAAVAALCLVLLIFAVNILFVFFGKTGGSFDDAKNYSLSALGRSNSDVSQISEHTGKDILLLSTENASADCKLYFDRQTNVIKAVTLKYKFIALSGTEEVYLVADLYNGLNDFKSFKNFTQITVYENKIGINKLYKNGEYYTNAYFCKEGIDYYVIIMSPSNGQGEKYIEDLLMA